MFIFWDVVNGCLLNLFETGWSVDFINFKLVVFYSFFWKTAQIKPSRIWKKLEQKIMINNLASSHTASGIANPEKRGPKLFSLKYMPWTVTTPNPIIKNTSQWICANLRRGLNRSGGSGPTNSSWWRHCIRPIHTQKNCLNSSHIRHISKPR